MDAQAVPAFLYKMVSAARSADCNDPPSFRAMLGKLISDTGAAGNVSPLRFGTFGKNACNGR